MRTLLFILGPTIFSFYSTTSRSYESCQYAKPDYSVAIQFVNDYVDFCNDPTSEMGWVEWVNNRDDITNDFKSEIERILTEAEKEDPELGLGFDPILDAQDYPAKFEIDKKDSDFLVAKGIDWPEFRLTLRLKYVKNNWLVDGSGIINIPESKRIKR